MSFTPVTLFVSCPGAKEDQDVLDTFYSTYGCNPSSVTNLTCMYDKSNRQIAFVTITPSPAFRHTRMDHLLRTLQAEEGNERYRGERMIFQTNPHHIEWSIKIAKPREERESSRPAFKPKFR
jgi:hypothetical protein